MEDLTRILLDSGPVGGLVAILGWFIKVQFQKAVVQIDILEAQILELKERLIKLEYITGPHDKR